RSLMRCTCVPSASVVSDSMSASTIGGAGGTCPDTHCWYCALIHSRCWRHSAFVVIVLPSSWCNNGLGSIGAEGIFAKSGGNSPERLSQSSHVLSCTLTRRVFARKRCLMFSWSVSCRYCWRRIKVSCAKISCPINKNINDSFDRQSHGLILFLFITFIPKIII